MDVLSSWPAMNSETTLSPSPRFTSAGMTMSAQLRLLPLSSDWQLVSKQKAPSGLRSGRSVRSVCDSSERPKCYEGRFGKPPCGYRPHTQSSGPRELPNVSAWLLRSPWQATTRCRQSMRLLSCQRLACLEALQQAESQQDASTASPAHLTSDSEDEEDRQVGATRSRAQHAHIIWSSELRLQHAQLRSIAP